MIGLNLSSPPFYPYYTSKTERLKSFATWPLNKISPSPEALADAGFFYTGLDDKTICFYCGGGLNEWEAQDDPWMEHLRLLGRWCHYVSLKFNKTYI